MVFEDFLQIQFGILMDILENTKNLIYLTTSRISDLHHYDRIQQNIHHMHCLTY